MPRFGRIIASAAVSLSLIASSTAAIASTETAPPPPASDSWVALSMLTPSGTALVGTTGVTAAAQPDTAPPPYPPAYGARPGPPPIPVLIVWGLVLATIIYIAVHNNHHHPHANSPA